MELIGIAATLALSIGLGLAGARGLLTILLFVMERSIAQQGARTAAVSLDGAHSSPIGVSSRDARALAIQAA